MTIVAFISQKGGVGKSTLARTLAVECAKSDLSVKIADCDIQQTTIFDWQKVRSDNNIFPQINVSSYESVEKCLKDAKNSSYDLLIIDTPARTSQGTLLLAQKADILIQPIGASRDDIVPALREFNSLVKAKISKEKLCFALNRIGSANEEINVRQFIKDSGYFIFEGYLPEKTSYRQAHNEGKAISEVSFKSLLNKSDKLLQSIIDKLSNNN